MLCISTFASWSQGNGQNNGNNGNNWNNGNGNGVAGDTIVYPPGLLKKWADCQVHDDLILTITESTELQTPDSLGLDLLSFDKNVILSFDLPTDNDCKKILIEVSDASGNLFYRSKLLVTDLIASGSVVGTNITIDINNLPINHDYKVVVNLEHSAGRYGCSTTKNFQL